MLRESTGEIPSPRPIRVAFCSASVGCGHTRAAVAVHDALAQRGRLESAVFLEALEDAPRWFATLYRDGYLAAIRGVPRLVGAIYDRCDVPLREHRLFGSMLDRAEDWIFRRLRVRSELHAADVVVSTHFLTTAILGRMRQRGDLMCPLVTVVTDEHPHAVWLHSGCDLTCVSTASAYDTAVEGGLSPSRVVATGIPIDPRFCTVRPAILADARKGSVSTVLVCGGGHGLGEIATAVESLVHANLDARVVVVCGRNQRLERQLTALAESLPGGAAKLGVLGYTNQMHELLARADLMVGKPGGLTSTEARALGVPMLLLRPIPGQEERNATLLVAAGAALQLRTASKAGSAAARVLGNPEQLWTMRAAAAASGRPRSAFDVATLVARAADGATPLAAADRIAGKSAAS